MDQSFNRIELMIENGDVKNAREKVDQLLKHNDKDANAHALLSEIYMHSYDEKDLKEAIKEINTALSLSKCNKQFERKSEI